MTQNLHIDALYSVLQQLVEETTASAAQLAATTSQIIAHDRLDKNKAIKLSNAERVALQVEIKTALSASAYSQGMGFASYTPETIDEKDYWTLEWWYKKEDQLQQAKLENYQNAQRFLDFRSFEWFQQPAKNKQPCIHGPYVDYICNGAYTITIAHPVMVADQFIGVIAIDILVSALEKMLLPDLKHIKQTTVITNASDRVITSNDISIRTGSLLKRTADVPHLTRPCASFQLVLL